MLCLADNLIKRVQMETSLNAATDFFSLIKEEFIDRLLINQFQKKTVYQGDFNDRCKS